MNQRSLRFTAVIILSVTNLEMLQLLPWQVRNADRIAGMPASSVACSSLALSMLEDIPQLAIQVCWAHPPTLWGTKVSMHV